MHLVLFVFVYDFIFVICEIRIADTIIFTLVEKYNMDLLTY